jgi:hypothetical protein
MTPSAPATVETPKHRSETVPPAGPTAIELLEHEPAVRRIHPAQDVLAVARELAGLRDADAEGGPTARRLEALETVRAERGERLAPAELVAALAGRQGWASVKTPRKLAMVLGPMGIFRRQVREGKRRRWCYLLDAERMAELRTRYGADG